MTRKYLSHAERVQRDLRLVAGFSRERLIRFCQNATEGVHFGNRKPPEEMTNAELFAFAQLIITS